MSLHNIYYAFPNAAYLLVGMVIIAILFAYLFRFRNRKQQQFVSSQMLHKLMIPRSTIIFWAKVAALCGTWALSTLALMQPVSYGNYPAELSRLQNPTSSIIRQRPAHQVILLIDASASMAVTDGRNGESRLDLAKEVADAIVSKLDGQTVALHAFTSEVTQLSPPTLDYLYVRLMLRDLHLDEGGAAGTDFANALKEMHSTYFNESTALLKSLVIISDGGDTFVESQRGPSRQQAIDDLLKLVNNSSQNNFHVFTIGTGSANGGIVPKVVFEGKPVHSSIMSELLQQLSENGQGAYYLANDYAASELASKVVEALKHGETMIQEQHPQKILAQKSLIHDLYFQIPLGLAILLLAFVLLFPDTLTKRISLNQNFLLLMIFSGLCCQSVNAIEQSDLNRQMQQAHAHFETGNYEKARQLYLSILEEPIEEWQRAVVLYDLGCVFLAEGKWDQAKSSLNAVPLDNDLAPLLHYRISYNLAVANLKEGISLVSQNRNIPKAIDNLQEAIQQIDNATTENCSLEQAKGYQDCFPNPALDSMKKLAERYLEKAKNLKQSNAPETSSEEAPSEPEQQQMHQEKINTDVRQALHQLEQMNIEDSESQKEQPILKKELRPW